MKTILLFSVVATLLGTSLWAKSINETEYKKGQDLYNNKCHICHGKKGEGNGPGAVAFSPGPANFTDPKFWRGDVDKKISDTVKNGRPPMPAFNLTPDQIKAIIYYMEHTFKK